MIEGSGNVLVDGGNVDNNFKNLSELTAPHFQTIAETDSGVVEFQIDGVDYMANVYQSSSLGWKFVGVKEKYRNFCQRYPSQTYHPRCQFGHGNNTDRRCYRYCSADR
jgi:hypothetical protein